MADSFILQGRYDLIDNVTQSLKGIDEQVYKSGIKLKESESKFASFNNSLGKFGKGMTDFGKKMTAFVTVPLAGLGAGAFNLASDYQESMNKIEVACGDGADGMKEFANSTLQNFGIAKGTALDMMSTWSDMGTGMQLSQQKANDMSKSLLGLAGDLASFKNVRIDVAQTALTGIYTGETESLKQLGIVMTQTNLQEFARQKGITKTIDKMSQAELVQLRYNYVMDKTKNAQGDFAKTSDGASNQMRIFSEGVKELGATLGENLLPLITPIIQKLNEWVQNFGKMDADTQKLVLALGGFALILPPIITGVGGLITAISTIIGLFTAKTAVTIADTTAQVGVIGATGAWTVANGGLMASLIGVIAPILAIVAGIALVIGIGYLLVNNWDWISQKASEVWSSVTGFFTEFDTFLTGMFSTNFTEAFGNFGEVLNAFMQNAENIWNGVKQFFGGIIDFIAGVFTGDWSRAWDGVMNIFGGIFNTMQSIAKAPINAVIGLLNWMIGGINDALTFELPDWIPGIGGKGFSVDIPKIGYLEEGGILTTPTFLNPGFVAGEKNQGRSSQAEAVIPLDRLFSELKAMFNDREFIINIDGREFMRAVAPYNDEIDKYNNQLGYL